MVKTVGVFYSVPSLVIRLQSSQEKISTENQVFEAREFSMGFTWLFYMLFLSNMCDGTFVSVFWWLCWWGLWVLRLWLRKPLLRMGVGLWTLKVILMRRTSVLSSNGD